MLQQRTSDDRRRKSGVLIRRFVDEAQMLELPLESPPEMWQAVSRTFHMRIWNLEALRSKLKGRQKRV
jgi:hypothetical protein